MAASTRFREARKCEWDNASKLIFGGFVGHFLAWLMQMVFILLTVKQISRIVVVIWGLVRKYVERKSELN